jgi:hypothetical protein
MLVWFQLLEKSSNFFGTLAPVSAERFRREGLAIGGIVLAGFIVYVFYLGDISQSRSSFGDRTVNYLRCEVL